MRLLEVARLSWAPFARLVPITLTAAAGAAIFSACALAQTAAHFSGVVNTVGSGFNSPNGVAVDSAGNVFVADTVNHAVKEIVAVNGRVSSSSSVIMIGSGFNSPDGVAVDSAGNVFVGDSLSNAVKEIVAVSGVVSSSSTVITIGSGFNYPYGVAVDSAGNVFVADTDNNLVKEIVAVSGVVSSTSAVITVGSGFSFPFGLAVDSFGNVFVGDDGNSVVKEIVAVSGVVSPSSTVNTIGRGFSYPSGVAVDSGGDVFVADYNNSEVKEIVAVNGVVSSSSTVNAIGSGFYYPQGVAVDSGGNVFVADTSNDAVKEIELATPLDLGTVPVATNAPPTLTLDFTFDTGGTIGAPIVFTQGSTGLDFADVGTGSCTTNGTSYTYRAGDTCTVDVTFTPRYPWRQLGAVELVTGSGAAVATEPITGMGTGPQIAFLPSTANRVGSGFNGPAGVAVDGAGNIFVADYNNNLVKEIVAVNGAVSSSSMVNTVGSGFNGPVGVAVDGVGNIFVADYGDSLVEEIMAVNGAVSSSSTVNTVGSGFSFPYSVAVDSAGNVFVGDYNNNLVKEIVAVHGAVSSSSMVNTVGSGFNGPVGVAVDSAGNVFVADKGNGAVKEIVAVDGVVSSGSTVNTIGSGFSSPAGVFVDSAGNVFVADSNIGVEEIVAVNGVVSASSTVNTIGSGFNNPYGVAVDSAGNVFVADKGNDAVKEIAGAPSLSFLSTTPGLTSNDSPQTVTVSNIGNAVLTFEVPGGGLNPSISAGFTFGTSSTCPQLSTSSAAATLAAGASCTDLISFMPTAAGPISGSLVLTDTALNAVAPNYATQSITLSGTGIVPDATQTAVSALPSPVTVGQQVTLTAVVSDTTTPASVPTGGVSFTDSVGGTLVSLNNGTALPLSGGIATLPITLTVIGVHTITANYIGSAGAFAAGAGSVSLTVAAIAPTLSFGPIAAQTFGNPPFAVSATSASTGAVTYAVVSGPATLAGNTLTLTGVGTVMLSASQAASGNYAAATATASFNVAAIVPTLSFGPIAAQTFGNPPFAVSATSASTGAVTYAVVSGPATLAGNTLTLTGAGTVMLSASQAASGNYAAATANASFTVAAMVPTLSFGPIAAQTFGNPPFAVSATSASTGAVTYAVVSGPATITGNTLTLTGAGTVVLSASQAANGNYAAATASASFTVAAMVPTLSFGPIAAQTLGNPPFSVSATSASTGAVTYAVVSGPATLAGNTLTLTGAGTVMLSASQAASGNYAAATASASFNVAAMVPTLSFGPIAAQTFGNPPFAVSATSASTGAVTYGVVSGPATITGNTLTLTGAGTVMLSASQAANGNYAAATASASFNVAAIVPTLSFGPIAAQTFGNPPFAVSATSASTGAVTYAVVSGPATLAGNTLTLTGAGTVMLSASQAANGNYAATTASASFTVAAIVPTLSFGPIAAQTFGNPPFAVSATSASTGAVTYAVVSGPATLAGNTLTLTGAGAVMLSASQAANGNYAATTASASFTVAAMVPTLSFGPIAAQTFGNPPFAVSATSASTGAVTYAIVSGPATLAGNTLTLTGAGAVMLSASQAASGNYAAATATTNFTVAAATAATLTTNAGSGVETVLPGAAAVFYLLLAPGPETNDRDVLTLSASGLPAGATATFSPATIPAGSGATPITMTIQTVNQQTANGETPLLGGQLGSMAMAFLLLPVAAIKPGRRRLRKLPVLLAAALLWGAMACLGGCGSSGGFLNQAPKSYTVVVTATSTVTGAHSSTNVTLTVQ